MTVPVNSTVIVRVTSTLAGWCRFRFQAADAEAVADGALAGGLAIEPGDFAQHVVERHQRKSERKRDRHHQEKAANQSCVVGGTGCVCSII
jgi:hypothetical protein